MAIGEPAVSVRGLSKHFRVRRGVPVESVMGSSHWLTQLVIRTRSPEQRFTALDGVSFDIAPGEFFGLLGPNGAGKTTLLKCLATLLRPDGGTAVVNGHDVCASPDLVRLSVTMIGSGQWVAFDWGLSVRENLQFFADLYGLPPKSAHGRIEEALEVVGLSGLIDATPQTLSSGERQRLVLAKGFLLRTPVFFMDEPAANLDPRGTADILHYIRHDLARLEGVTVIYTSHRLEEVEELCDRVAILDRGRLVALDTPRRLVRLVTDVEHLEVDFTGTAAGVLERVAALPGVRGLDLASGPVAGSAGTLRIQCESAERSSGDVVTALGGLGLSVTAVRASAPRLGDVFLRLTGRGLHHGV